MSLGSFLDNEPLDKIGRNAVGLKFEHSSDPEDTSAQDTYAALTKKSWYDYMHTLGVPQENKLIDYATNPQVVTDAMASASTDATGAFDRQAVNTQRSLATQGLTLTPEEQGASDRDTGLARSLADVGAQNRARDTTIARQQSILGNPAPAIGSIK